MKHSTGSPGQGSEVTLYVFAISHFCEKARWALDYLGIDYALKFTPPGVHQLLAKRLGVPRTSLPIIVVDGKAIQGSAAIIDWAESVASSGSIRLSTDNAREEGRQIEKRLDKLAGVHVRRYYYSEALVEYPQTVRPVFTHGLSMREKLMVLATWGAMRKMMIKGMDLGPEQGQDSRHIVDEELAWLDEILADGRGYLVGSEFSRADLTAASLLAPLVLPKEHPVYAGLKLPPQMAEDLTKWENRPTLQWVRKIYSAYR